MLGVGEMKSIQLSEDELTYFTSPAKRAEIDELLLQDLESSMVKVELNRKGYKAKHCCSGHISEPVSAAYIAVDSNADCATIPEGFKMKEENEKIVLRSESLTKRLGKKPNDILTGEDKIKIADFIKSDMQKLREWVKELPEKC